MGVAMMAPDYAWWHGFYECKERYNDFMELSRELIKHNKKAYKAPDYPNATGKFPEYFEGNIILYEWMRDWIYVVTLDENQNYKKAEPFMPSTVFSKPMDMIFGSDGDLYVLEYGRKWNSQNMDARLSTSGSGMIAASAATSSPASFAATASSIATSRAMLRAPGTGVGIADQGACRTVERSRWSYHGGSTRRLVGQMIVKFRF